MTLMGKGLGVLGDIPQTLSVFKEYPSNFFDSFSKKAFFQTGETTQHIHVNVYICLFLCNTLKCQMT